MQQKVSVRAIFNVYNVYTTGLHRLFTLQRVEGSWLSACLHPHTCKPTEMLLYKKVNKGDSLQIMDHPTIRPFKHVS
jgi:hypothetical protein